MRHYLLLLLAFFLISDLGQAAFMSSDVEEESYSSSPAGFDGSGGMSGAIGPSTTNGLGFGAGDATANMGVANSSTAPIGSGTRLGTENALSFDSLRSGSGISATSGILSSHNQNQNAAATRKARNYLT